jgi:hypothetical protein
MKKKEEIWVEEVLQSIDGIARAQAPEHLEIKLQNKIKSNEAKIIPMQSTQLRWMAAAVILLIGLNVFLLTQRQQKLASFRRNNQTQDYSFEANELIKL